jgi:hypothetical protein
MGSFGMPLFQMQKNLELSFDLLGCSRQGKIFQRKGTTK